MQSERQCMAFIDIEKAYDRVNRDFLFQKLQAYRFPPKIIAVLQSMYTEPKMVVMWDSYQSEPYSMHCCCCCLLSLRRP